MFLGHALRIHTIKGRRWVLQLKRNGTEVWHLAPIEELEEVQIL